MKITAHRSGPDFFPEQTVDSARRSVENGADMVEIDLRFTKDNKIAVSHDKNINRLFGIDREISDMTLDEYKSLSRKDNCYTGYGLDDYISAGISPLLLHIKEGGDKIPEILAFLKDNNYLDKVTFGVSCPEDVRIVRDYGRNIPVLAFMSRIDMIDDCIKEGADYIRLWQGWADKEKIDYIHSEGKEVWIMTGGTDGLDVGETGGRIPEYILNKDVDCVLINNINEIINLR